MKKSLISALGLAVVLGMSAPVLAAGATHTAPAAASTSMKHHAKKATSVHKHKKHVAKKAHKMAAKKH